MNIFYCGDAVLNQMAAFDEMESKHIATVLRKREGEELYVFDGRGNLFEARILSITKKEVGFKPVKLLEKQETTKPALHIAIAPPKNIERMEWFIEKATEIGISEITPILCKHSERKDVRIDRLEKVMLSACKQSLHYRLPKLNTMKSFAEVIQMPTTYRRFIAHLDEKAIHLQDAYHGGFDALILIGPEGDFSNEEIAQAGKQEFETVTLGTSRLRLETAGVYATTVFNLVNE